MVRLVRPAGKEGWLAATVAMVRERAIRQAIRLMASPRSVIELKTDRSRKVIIDW
jgi:hypothetical protein